MVAIITSDLHLNDNPRDEYRWQTCEAIIRYSQKIKPDMAFICGDLTDDKDNHSATLVNRIVKLLPRFAPEVFVLRGNHDCIDPDNPFFAFIDDIQGLSFIGNKPRFVVVKQRPGLDTCALLMANGAFNPALILQKKPTIVLCHETFDGADAGGHRLNGLPLPKTKTPIISGDVHIPQQVGPVTYVGAPTLTDFGDDYEPRIIKLEDDGRRISVKLHAPTKRLIEVRVTTNGVLDFPKSSSVRRGDIVKIRLIFTTAPPPERVQEYREMAAKLAEHVHSIEFQMPKGSLPADHFTPKTDKELALSIAKAHGFDGPTTKVGLDIVEGKDQ